MKTTRQTLELSDTKFGTKSNATARCLNRIISKTSHFKIINVNDYPTDNVNAKKLVESEKFLKTTVHEMV
ncbi:CLUMA_CG016098, isoform A [Clunio marinus]|uniref:CLUMA_CG016098, isoform A n=1 Tax=Clunio marinus TaxID=568069 RepID=A0A1J1IR62_9DIPT|nr:CLUMA_CG016098, isoform A [Clunio marinus]